MVRAYRWFVVVALVLGVTAGAPASALAASRPAVYAAAATIVTSEGTVIWSKNPDRKRKVASTIKMLNALVAREQEPDMDHVITVTKPAARIYNGTVGLRVGQKLTVRELLTIMLVHSANDAAEALGVGIAGSEKKYVKLMNAKAKQLGLRHTKAADPHGLGKHEHSSAADLSVIARHLMADPELRKIVQRRACRVPRRGGSSQVYSTTNQLLGSYRGITGIKTGYTDPAGYCFVGSAERGGIELYAVVLGAGSSGDRFTQARRLLDWGFAHVSTKRLVSAEETMGVVEVEKGAESSVAVRPVRSLTLAVGDCGETLSTRVALAAVTPAPVTAGQRLGTVEVVRKNSVVASVPLVAEHGVAVKSVGLGALGGHAASKPEETGFFGKVAQVMAGIGRMLGI